MAHPATNFRLASPYQDWQSGQSIFWGTTNSPSTPQIDVAIASKIRCEAIAANFQTKEPNVITLGPVASYPREKVSPLSIFHSAFQGAYREGRLLKNIAQIAGIFAAAVGAMVLTASLHSIVSSRTKNDFVTLLAWVAAVPIGVVIGKSIVFILEKLAKNDPLSLFAIFGKLTQMNQGSHALVQDIKKSLSSVGNIDLATLANNKDGDEWLDPISLEPIPKDRIRAPCYFLIGKYVSHVKNVLKVIFNYFDETHHKIRHPIENRFMSEEENTKFLKDICALFSMTETEFLNLWNDHPITGIPDSLLEKTNDIRCMLRLFNLLKLIPADIREHDIKGIVRHDQIDLFARMSILLAQPNKWSFDHPDGWIELPVGDDNPTLICQLLHPGAVAEEFAFPPAILLTKYIRVQSLEEHKAELMQPEPEGGATKIELGRFFPSVDEGVLYKFIGTDQTSSYHFFIFKEGTVFRLKTIAHQNDFAAFSNIFKQVICSFRLGDDVNPTTPEKLAEFERLIGQR